MPRAGIDQTRSLRGHACFAACSNFGDCLTGFDLDNRPTCRSNNEGETGIICVDPYKEACEDYIEAGMICLDAGNKVCILWRHIIFAVIAANIL